MSGVLSSVIGASSALEALFGGGQGVSIGGVTLAGFEIPEQVTWGGAQQLAVHRFPGGAKQVDATGFFDRVLSWSGIMYSSDATTRARSLDVICRQGSPVQLQFADFQYLVIVRSFEADYARANWTRQYRIECEVIPPDPGTYNTASIAQDGATDQASISSAFNLGGIASAVSGAVSQAGTALASTAVTVADSLGISQQFTLGPEFQMAADTGIPTAGTGAITVGLSGIGAAPAIVANVTGMVSTAQGVLSAASAVGAFIPGGGQAAQSLISKLNVAQSAVTAGSSAYSSLIGVVSGQESLASTPLGFSVMQGAIAAQSAVSTASDAMGRTLANLTASQ